MLRYVATRFAIWIPSVLLVMLGVYALAFYGAGNPIKLVFLRAPGDVAYDPARIDAIRESAGLNRPFIEQFGSYILNLLQSNFGNSLNSGRSVWALISAAAAPVSFQLGLCSIILTAVVAIPLGLIAGIKQNSRLDYTILGSALFLWAILPMSQALCSWSASSLWPPYARLVRAQVLSIRSRPYVTASRALGLSTPIILMRYVVPNALGPLIVSFSAGLGTAMVLESAFSFLGVGVNPPTPSWGNMISDGLRVWQHYPHLLAAPAIVLGLATIAFSFLGDGLNDALNPRGSK